MTNKIKSSIFKAYDIRGKYPDEINDEAVAAITSALAQYWLSKVRSSKSKVLVVAHDARLSSPALYNSVINALITNNQLQIVKVGLSTTPMFYFLVNDLDASGGIMVTASHNPKEYNGLKIVGPGAAVISGKEIEKLVISNE